MKIVSNIKHEIPREERNALEGLKQAFAIYQFIDKRVVTLLLSDGFLDLFGYKDREKAIYDMDNDMYCSVHQDDIARISDAAIDFAVNNKKYDVIYRSRKLGEELYHIIHAYGAHVITDDGYQIAQIWYVDEGIYTEGFDLVPEKLSDSLSKALQFNRDSKNSLYDLLTGLPNMTYFFELAGREKVRLFNAGLESVILYLDLGGMKFFNNKYGFAEGDKLLRSFAKELSGTFGQENCSRFASDHFAVITKEEGLEDRLFDFFERVKTLNDNNSLPVRVGIYQNSIEDIPLASACDRAKLVCDSIKIVYMSDFDYYDKTLSDLVVKRQYIIDNIDKALENRWVKVYYQPVVRAVNNCVSDEEALSRWDDPVYGFMYPAEFIPVLEEADLIYKLDLYVVDRIVDKILFLEAKGIDVIPQSINLSRSDFSSCDIISEITSRVDNAGIMRNKISVEVTESVIGKDFNFIKKKIEKFRELGFHVWMDDFGSGYSSLDILKDIKFDLIKFDMNFLRELDKSEYGKIILSEQIRMVNDLGLDSICEGVETKEQAKFLQEMGCSKLQGFLFSKPICFEDFAEKGMVPDTLKFENLNETNYYEAIGRFNLNDFNALIHESNSSINNVFDSLPVGIIEVQNKGIKFIRSSQSFVDFLNRYFGFNSEIDDETNLLENDDVLEAIIIDCCKSKSTIFHDFRLGNNSVVHFFVKHICTNPVNGNNAIAFVVLSVTDATASTSYAEIARSLAADYYNIFVIDLDNDDYIEYSSSVGREELALERHGNKFFESAKADTMTRVYAEDRDLFLSSFNKERILHDLDIQGVFTLTYRLIDSGKPVFATMKATKMNGTNRLIIGVSIIDEQMKQQEAEKKLRDEKVSLGRIAALYPNLIVLYTVDLETGNYIQYNPSSDFSKYGLASHGDDFFGDVVKDAPKAIDPKDLENHLRVFTKDNILKELKDNHLFIHRYRLINGTNPIPVTLRATMIEENGKRELIVGVVDESAEKKRKQMKNSGGNMWNDDVIYANIAESLARGYTDLFYVNMETDEFIEFHTDDILGVLSEVRRSDDFFVGCKRDGVLYVHPDDQELFIRTMDRQFLSEALDNTNVYEFVYRRLLNGEPLYVRMRVTRMEQDRRFIVVAVSDFDEVMKKRFAEKRIHEERTVYARLHALTGNFAVVYVVDPVSGQYHEFSATQDYESGFGQAKEGYDFFEKVRHEAVTFNYPDDLDKFLKLFTKENVLNDVRDNGMFTLNYRILIDGQPVYFQLKAAMVEEEDGERLVVGLNNIDAEMKREEEKNRKLLEAQNDAHKDALTGVRNRHAYLETETLMDSNIKNKSQKPFAIVMFDLNDLKVINDKYGHNAGDEYLRNACKLICNTFKHSPVYRVGGDEFVAICQDSDYSNLQKLLDDIALHNKEAAEGNGIVIACGAGYFDSDDCVATVFERADHAMYANKNKLKNRN